MGRKSTIEKAMQFHQNGEYDKAYNTCQKIVKSNPENIDALQLQGALCINLDKFNEAEHLLSKAILLLPNQAIFHTNLAIALDRQNKFKKAQKHFEISLNLDTDNYMTLFAYARSLELQNNLEHSKNLYLKVLKIVPTHEGAMLNLASIYISKDNIPDALVMLESILENNPENARALNNLGNVYRKTDLDKAVDYFYKATLIDATLAPALTNLLLCAANISDWNKADHARHHLKSHKTSIPPLLFINEDTNNLVSNIENAKQFIPHISSQHQFKHRRKNNVRPVIGYLSCDFFDHATAHLMQGLFEEHNYKMNEIHIFSYGKNDSNSYLIEIKKHVKNFHDISEYDDHSAAKYIFDKSIDILIDLKGHTQNSRLRILAYRPAPIQAHYLGFPDTVGANYIDYYIGDEIITPKSMQNDFVEEIINLPHCYQVNMLQSMYAPPSRLENNLPENGFIFASFNQNYKISKECFNAWMKILQRTSNTYLWLIAGTQATETNILSHASKYNIAKERIVFAEGLSKHKHLNRLQLADLALDTINYNGHTTTSDCLMANVPVITIQGHHTAARVSASILNEVKLNELITHSLDEYINLAISLAQHNKSNALKNKLKKNIDSCIMFKPKAFAQSLENLYQELYDKNK
ncbi:MAG: tetratricopeptide repeat protein [Francisellaceae bacterium]|nr:tetratricopeptide repeat protein [Francisellaceae bacterium]MBT6538086.1 tetratricopeptide repeat protein [Francisellaceae bacterium]